MRPMRMTSSIRFSTKTMTHRWAERDCQSQSSAEERSAQVYRWGKRLSGVTWSPGGAISFVQYDKTLESRLRNKRFMEPIWRAAGWDGTGVRHSS